MTHSPCDVALQWSWSVSSCSDHTSVSSLSCSPTTSTTCCVTPTSAASRWTWRVSLHSSCAPLYCSSRLLNWTLFTVTSNQRTFCSATLNARRSRSLTLAVHVSSASV